MRIKCSSEITAKTGEALTAGTELTEWADSLPAGTTLTAVIHDHGSQRDPMPVLTGLRATWDEDR